MAVKPVTTPADLLRQGAAGLIESSVANAALPGEKYRPAIAYTLPAAGGAIYDLARTYFTGKAPENTGGFVDTSMERIGIAADNTNEFLGIDNPSNAAEMASRVGLSLLVPGGGIAKGAGKAAGAVAKVIAPTAAVKAGNAAKQVLAMAPKKVKTGAKVAAEIVSPIRIVGGSSVKAGVPIAAGAAALGVGIGELADNLMPNNEYTSLRESMVGVRDEYYTDVEGNLQLDAEAADYNREQLNDADDLSNATIAALGAAGIAFGVRGVFTRQQAARDAAVRQQVGNTKLVGKDIETSDLLSAGDSAATKLFDSSIPLRTVGNRLVDGFGDYIANRAARASNVASGAKAGHFMKTGQFTLPNGKVQRSVPLGPVLEAAGKELDDVSYARLNDALVSRTTIDTYNATGNLTTNVDKFGNPITLAQHQQNVSGVMNDPKLAKYVTYMDRSMRDLLRFKLDAGIITRDEFFAQTKRNPNFAELAQDFEGLSKKAGETKLFDANRLLGLNNRTGTEGAGIKGGQFAPPMNLVADAWTSTIKSAEINHLRKEFLEMGVARNSKLIKRVQGKAYTGSAEKGRVQTVYDKGEPIDYIVKDPVLSDALSFFPRATVDVLGHMRAIGQAGNTGVPGSVISGSLFTVLKSPIYDSLMSMVNKPKGMNLGLLNEMLASVSSGKLSIGRADPTAFVSGYVYFARIAADELKIGMANRMATNLITGDHGIFEGLGPQRIDALQKALQNSYEASIKASMDRTGASSGTLWGSPDMSRAAAGLEEIAPAAVRQQSRYVAREIIASDMGEWGKAVALSKNAVVSANAHFFVRTMMKMGTMAHNSARYGAYATNQYNKNIDPMVLAAAVRDITSDTAKFGSSASVQAATDIVMYFNVGMQAIYRTGQTFVRDPVNFAANFGATGAMMIAAYLHSQATDPDVLAINQGKTIEQKIQSMTLWGGVEYPIEHFFRPMLGMILPVIDEVFGINDGELDLPSIAALSEWLEDDTSDEVLQDSMSRGIASGLEGLSPIPINIDDEGSPVNISNSGNPAFDAMLVVMGVDPTQLRLSGRAAAPREVDYVADPNNVNAGSPLFGATAKSIVAALFGTAGQSFADMSNDVAKAIGAGGSLGKGLEVAGSRYTDALVRGATVNKPIAKKAAADLFGPYEVKESVADAIWSITQGKDDALRAFNKMYNDENLQGRTNRSASGEQDGRDVPLAPLEGDLAVIAEVAKAASSDPRMSYANSRLTALTAASRNIQNGFLTNIGTRNTKLNEVAAERKEMTALKLHVLHEYEGVVRERTGEIDFTWDGSIPQ